MTCMCICISAPPEYRLLPPQQGFYRGFGDLIRGSRGTALCHRLTAIRFHLRRKRLTKSNSIH
ncbi:hypothetical protein ACLOJK_000307 [Asimina triloba]